MMKLIRLKCCLGKLVTVFSLVQHVISKLEVWFIHATEIGVVYRVAANHVERGWPKHVPNQIAVVVIVQNCSKNIPYTTGSGMRVVSFVKISFNVFQTSISGSSTVAKNYCKLKDIIDLSIFQSSLWLIMIICKCIHLTVPGTQRHQNTRTSSRIWACRQTIFLLAVMNVITISNPASSLESMWITTLWIAIKRKLTSHVNIVLKH